MTRFNPEEFTQDVAQQNRLARVCGQQLPTVVAFGAYSHGKSSLLNSLIGEECFSVSDRVETLQVQEHVSHGVSWIDTPGLYADTDGIHDEQALAAVHRADYLLLIHRAATGELDAQELSVFRELNNAYPHRCSLILSAIDEISAESQQRLFEKVSEQLPDIQVIAVSAACYSNGLAQNKQGLVKHSNIPDLQGQIASGLSRALASRHDDKRHLVRELVEEIEQQLELLYREKSSLREKASRVAESYEWEVIQFRAELLHKFAQSF